MPSPQGAPFRRTRRPPIIRAFATTSPLANRMQDAAPLPWYSYVLWPALMVACISITALGVGTERDLVYFNAAYLLLIVSLLVFEWRTPHEPAWQRNDGQTFANIAHTLSSKGVVQGLLLFSAYVGLSTLVTPVAEPHDGLWPRHWPMWAQASLALVIAEFPMYWAHRISHEWPPLWRFHAIHHSVTRLWIVNTGRFHVVDSLISIVGAAGILIVLGAPMEVLKWLGAITAFIGMLTHCNVRMGFGPLSQVFNTPELHRWHHSRRPEEGNSNYGQNLMLWDQLFGTYLRPARTPPVDIGINEPMPPTFLRQLAWPFRRAADELTNRSPAG